MDKYLGMKLDNRYEILEVIGSGGMAVVYKARDHRLNRLVAIKVLREDLALDADFRRRFQTESRAVAMLSNPNIVAVYDVSKSSEIEYIVMELIEGITLKQYMNRKGQLSWKESLHFANQITKALSHAHSRGIIHRDIKPHNIMILKDGSVKVADFGIARLQSNQSTTLTQEALGSVHYISPEQAKGAHVDERSDIYSVGVVMYEMLTSKLPFEGESPVSVAIQHISSTPISPRDINPDIPKGLEAITMKAMDPSLETRYQSADELLRDMEDFRKNPDMMLSAAAVPVNGAAENKEALPEDEAENKPSKKEDKGKKKKKAKKTSALVGILCVIALIVAIIVFLWFFILKDLMVSSGERITIEDFTGLLYTDVIDNEEYTDIYDFTLEPKETDEHKENIVISQDPSSGRNVTKAEGELVEVTLTYAIPAVDRTMPDVVNVEYRRAKTNLEDMDLNLTVTIKEVASDDITKNYVVRSVPEAGSTLAEGDTVTLYVSTGPEVTTVNVPNLYGMSASRAESTLASYDLTYSVAYSYSSVTSANIVIAQSIAAGTPVAAKTEIVITVSQGAEPSAIPSPSPSPSPTPSPADSPAESPLPSEPQSAEGTEGTSE